MSTYQDVVNASLPLTAWALVEASGTTFAPYTGTLQLTGVGIDAYQQTGPEASMLSVHMTNGCLRNTTPFSGAYYWLMEAWFRPDATTRAGNALLLYDGGNSAANGWGVYLPTASNTLHIFYASPTLDITTSVVIPALTWTLIQVGNINGVQGAIDVAINGQLVTRGSDTAALVAPAGGFGFGGTITPAPNYTGRIAMPAIYSNQQTTLSLYSRFLELTDPAAALTGSLTGVGGAISGDVMPILQQILAAVHKTVPTT